MRRWKHRALDAEAEVARRDELEDAASEHIASVMAESDAQANAFYEALEQIREMDHGHPRNAAGAKLPSGRCPVCCVIAEVGV
mgnify:CR=1 FL=1